MMGNAFWKAKDYKNEVHIPKEEWKLGYLAGLLDGEGSIVIKRDHIHDKPTPRAQIAVYNTDSRILEWIRKEFGGGTLVSPNRRNPNPEHSRSYQLSYSAFKEVKTILEAIFPYLLIKKGKANEALNLCNRKLEQWATQRYKNRLERVAG